VQCLFSSRAPPLAQLKTVMRCTPSSCTPRNCSSSSCCWTRARFGLAASHLHMSESRASTREPQPATVLPSLACSNRSRSAASPALPTSARAPHSCLRHPGRTSAVCEVLLPGPPCTHLPSPARQLVPAAHVCSVSTCSRALPARRAPLTGTPAPSNSCFNIARRARLFRRRLPTARARPTPRAGARCLARPQPLERPPPGPHVRLTPGPNHRPAPSHALLGSLVLLAPHLPRAPELRPLPEPVRSLGSARRRLGSGPAARRALRASARAPAPGTTPCATPPRQAELPGALCRLEPGPPAAKPSGGGERKGVERGKRVWRVLPPVGIRTQGRSVRIREQRRRRIGFPQGPMRKFQKL
jgi:hypothetical protein